MTAHGHASNGKKTKLYTVWVDMKDRCYCKTDHAYERYGGRGIYVCDEWRSNFSQFLEDMGEPPTGMTIDRINNDGPYSPSNCRWATHIEQGANRRTAKLITFRGQTKPMKAWDRYLGFPYDTVRQRLRQGNGIEEALTRPTGRRGRG